MADKKEILSGSFDGAGLTSWLLLIMGICLWLIFLLKPDLGGWAGPGVGTAFILMFLYFLGRKGLPD